MNARPNGSSRSNPLVAVIGLGCVFPDAVGPDAFWRNVVERRSAISRVTPDRWRAEVFFSEDRDEDDRTYCQVGGFVRDWQFDSRAFRVPPASARVMDRAQQYALVAARQAFAEAGYDRRPFDHDRTAVIIGAAGGRFENEEQVGQRVQLPLFERALGRALDERGVTSERRSQILAAFRDDYLRGLVEITEDTFAGLCPNVSAGRIANFFDLHGPNYVVDAACASSLAAVDCAVDGLASGDFDLAVCGGIHAHMGLSLFVGFSKFHGLSPGRVSPFDEQADGFLLGEGAGLFLLKRLDDALRDGDPVMAVIRGVGSSSDGREKGIGAPNPKAQSLAMRRAMEAAGYSPATVQFIETHGAGTPVGDPAELDAMRDVFGPHLAPGQRIAISAVKSQVGHLMGAAGAAGLAKTILGLHRRVMPPTINHEHPSSAIPWDTLPFDVVTEPQPWPENRDGLPRRANVSSFGFGGNNFHVALEAFDPAWHGAAAAVPVTPPSREPVAIVGLGAYLPKSPGVEAFWQNVVDQVSAISEVPRQRWDGQADLYVDPDPDAADKSHSRLGGFADTPQLDPRRFRVSPATLTQIDPGQKQLLTSALGALDGTNVLASAERRQRTAVIFGDSGGCRELLWSFLARFSAWRARWTLQQLAAQPGAALTAEEAETIGSELVAEVLASRPRITEDSVVGIATSIGPARVAKSMDLMGTHMAVDAACGSSLAAVAIAVRGLQAGKWDAVVTGGVAGGVTPHLAVIASKARALSATGSRPFDAEADGFVAGEGAAAFVLKRLSDAMAEGDRIYGVIRGVGASSDGRGHSMYAPESKTQALAIRRAYDDSALPPESVQYIECHATSTPVGDPAELVALRSVFGERGAGRIGVGSVKAQIGHTMSAAGSAGLLKTVLGLDHKLLPPMPSVSRPIDGLDGAPFHIVTRAEPWPAPPDGGPRRAGVNAFGFGGTNWHVAVEEYLEPYHAALMASLASRAKAPAAAVEETPMPDTLLVAAGGTPDELAASIRGLRFPSAGRQGAGPWRLAFVAHSKGDFAAKLDLVTKHFRPGRRSPILEGQGIYAADAATAVSGPVAALFPGQGPQYADMLRDLAEEYDVVRGTIAEADEVLRDVLGQPYERLVFTASRTAEERTAVEQSLAERSDVLQPVLVTASVALYRLMRAHGLGPAAMAGHSLGEYGALVCAGVLDLGQALRAVHVRGSAFRDLAARSGDAGLMATVAAGSDVVQPALDGVGGYVAIANRNCPSQTVISGEERAVRDVVGRLEAQAVECRILPIGGAFHSRIAQAIRGRMEEAIARLDVRAPNVRVLSSVDLAYYEPSTDCAARVRTNLAEQLATPVDFIGLVERLYADGIRLFAEAGPKNALAGFVDDVLGADRPHRALFANHPKIGEIPQFDRFVAQFAVLDPSAPAGAPAVSVTAAPASPAAGVSPVGDLASRPAAAAAPIVRSGPPAAVAASAGPRPAVPADGAKGGIWITGVSFGLPGRGSRVFSDDGLDRLLAGTCLIEPISEGLQDRLIAKRINRLVKTEDGEPYLAEVTSREDVVKLAGQRGAFSLRDDYGLEDDWLLNGDTSYQLAVAAGLESLRDARIPLQRAYRKTSTGGSLRAGWMLPAPLQYDTAVVFASAFPGLNLLSEEFERYYAATYGAMAAGALRDQYLRRLDAARSEEERLAADQWFVDERRKLRLEGTAGGYRFNRNFLSDLICMGNSRFAQLVRARGPNLAVNAACCSTAVALATAEDFIRCGRARRVVVIGADDASSEALFEWVGAGFLAAGAAATDRNVADAALPFDRRRHGMVVGMGAVGFVVEAEADARRRGIEPVAELLGVRVSNSASHMTRPDVEHVAAEMEAFIAEMEARHGIDRRDLAAKSVYMSHETFTLPTGGIGAVEVQMLKRVFGERWRDVIVANTKCATGHPQGAGIEDAIIMKALQAGKLPPVLHSTQIDPDLAGIQLSVGGPTDREYALRFSAGFGSQVAMSLTRVGTRAATRVASEAQYQAWLEEVAGAGASLTVVNRILQVAESGAGRQSVGHGVQPAEPEARPAEQQAPRVVPRPAPATARASAPAVQATPTARLAPAPATSVAPPDARPEAAPAPARAPAASAADITEQILSIIEEKTGYERRYLELDLDLEADLGIDTIKQAQVMARIREVFQFPREKNVRVKDFPTLRHVVTYVQARLGGGAPAADPGRSPAPAQPVAAVPAGPAAQAPAPQAPPAPLTSPAPTAAHLVAAATIAAPAAPADSSGAVDERVLEAVLRIIEKQTGYEREALGLDLDLEADLGVDTIKQAQVMSRIREEFRLPREQGLRVKDFPTVRHVVGYVTQRVAATAASAAPVASAPAEPAAPVPSPQAPSADSRVPTPESRVPSRGVVRMAVRSANLPVAQEAANGRIGAGWTVLVTDDGLGVAEGLAQRLSEAGAVVEILPDETALDGARARLGRVRGLVMLHPLAAEPGVAAIGAEAWRQSLDRKVLAAFRLVKALRGELELAVAATAMAGPFGWRGQLLDPAGAGVAGLLKSLQHEAEAMRVKAIDVERPASPAEAAQLAATLLHEIEQGGRRVEVAYRDGARLVPRVVPEPIDLSVPARPLLGPDSVVIAIGGSRGATAAVVKELAARYRPHLWLVGTQTLPANVAELAALDAEGLKALKEKIAHGWKARVTRPKPVEIEKKYQATLRAIEASQTIDACRAAGASVSYHVCDVRDAGRVKDLVRSALRQHRRIDGLILGAGIIEDKLVEDKSLDSFARVFGVKAEGAFSVYKALDGVELSFLAAFTSVAGRFGNAGQSDYAAGNEVVARFVSLLQAARPEARCVAIDWTAWEEVGLAARSGAIDLLKENGLDTIAPEEGARFFHEEMAFGRGPEEVVVAGLDASLDHDGQLAPAPAGALPDGLASLLHASVFVDEVHDYAKGASLTATRSLDPRRDTWLRDHVIDGTPLLPAVFGIETMAEAACLLFPGFHFAGLRDLEVRLAVKVLKERATVLRISAAGRAGADADERVARVRITSDFTGPDGRVLVADRVHYVGDVVLRSTPAEARAGVSDAPRVGAAEGLPPLYGDGGTLPHGPAFQVLDRVDGLGEEGAVASVSAIDESAVVPSLDGHRLLTLPLAREAAFQAAGLWGIVRHGNFGLPHGCRSLSHFGVPPAGTRLSVRVEPRRVDPVRIEYDIDLVGDDDRLYDRMEGFYTVNPIAAAAGGGEAGA